MGTIATRLPDETKNWFEEMAKANNQTSSNFLRELIENFLDDQLDLKMVDEYRSWKENNPTAKKYTFDEARDIWGV